MGKVLAYRTTDGLEVTGANPLSVVEMLARHALDGPKNPFEWMAATTRRMAAMGVQLDWDTCEEFLDESVRLDLLVKLP